MQKNKRKIFLVGGIIAASGSYNERMSDQNLLQSRQEPKMIVHISWLDVMTTHRSVTWMWMEI